VAAYDAAIALRPRLASPWAARGVALLRAGDLAEAERSFARARDLGDDSAELYLSLGELAQRRGDPAQAVTHFREAEARASARGDAALAARMRAAITALGSPPP
jgi:Flp pilus assembly protein TadD